jgi:hypothetical protein
MLKPGRYSFLKAVENATPEKLRLTCRLRMQRGWKAFIEYNGIIQGVTMIENYEPLEKYLRGLPTSQDVVTLTFDFIEQVLNEQLPTSAHQEREWWGNQKQGTSVETLAWMNAGWLVDTVDLHKNWVRFVRQ